MRRPPCAYAFLNDRDLDGAGKALLESAPCRPCGGEQSRPPILDPAEVTRVAAEPLGCSGLGERVAVDQHRCEQHLFIAYRVEVLLQADLVGAMRRRGRELDLVRGSQLERCPQVALSGESEASALKETGQAAPLPPDRSQFASSLEAEWTTTSGFTLSYRRAPSISLPPGPSRA